ncbi:hypothetical protein NUSPORA_00265 [Nucleospora cyclopteri]
MAIIFKDFFLSKRLIHIVACTLVFCDIAKCIVLADHPYNKYIEMIIENHYAEFILLPICQSIFFISEESINLPTLIFGAFIALFEALISNVDFLVERSTVYVKFAECISIVIVFMLSEVLSGKLKKLEINTLICVISAAVMSAFVYKETEIYGIENDDIARIFICFSICNLLKSVAFASQGFSVLMVKSALKLLGYFVSSFFDIQQTTMTKSIFIASWDKRKGAICVYTILHVFYALSEAFCMRYIDLDRLLVLKAISMQVIFLYKKFLEH